MKWSLCIVLGFLVSCATEIHTQPAENLRDPLPKGGALVLLSFVNSVNVDSTAGCMWAFEDSKGKKYEIEIEVGTKEVFIPLDPETYTTDTIYCGRRTFENRNGRWLPFTVGDKCVTELPSIEIALATDHAHLQFITVSKRKKTAYTKCP